jgi:hypothetical protein
VCHTGQLRDHARLEQPCRGSSRPFPGRCAEDRAMSGPRSALAGRGWLATRRRASRPTSCRVGQRPGRLIASRRVGQAGHAMATSHATGRCCERAADGLAAPRRPPRARRGRAGCAGRPCRVTVQAKDRAGQPRAATPAAPREDASRAEGHARMM